MVTLVETLVSTRTLRETLSRHSFSIPCGMVHHVLPGRHDGCVCSPLFGEFEQYVDGAAASRSGIRHPWFHGQGRMAYTVHFVLNKPDSGNGI